MSRQDAHPKRAYRMPDAVIEVLLCPICRERMRRGDEALRCRRGHCFDFARQGYVNLLSGHLHAPTADNPDMIAARAEFLAAGHYRVLADFLARRVAEAAPDNGVIVDAGAGTGYYSATVLENQPARAGLGVDSSTAALRRCARAHPRLGAIAWDIWQPWPVADGVAAAVLNVFAPRNAAEFRRVLRADGALVVAVPGAAHLAELRELVPLLGINQDKPRQVDSTLAEAFVLEDREDLTSTLHLSAEDLRRVIWMGPTAHHLQSGIHPEPPEVAREPIAVTASFVVSVYRPR